MARLFHAGAEVDGAVPTSAQNTGPDGVKFGTGTLTRDTVTFRSGAASWKFDPGASNLQVNAQAALTPAAGTTYYLRGYFLIPANPGSTNRPILALGNTTGAPLVVLNTDGTLNLSINTTVQGSASSVVTADGIWHRVEISGTVTGTDWTAAELRLDGVSVATWSGTQALLATSAFRWGWVQFAPGASVIMNVDDIALNDSTGASNNSWPGSGNVVLLKPTADSAVGTGWTTSSASATGLFDNVNNTPPAGIADTIASNLHQIRNATSNANVNYDATMTTYTAAGVGAADTVNAVVEVVATGAPVTTSAKAGTFGIVSNPTVANVSLDATGTSGAFWAGATAGTYGAGWKWSFGAVQNLPTVTLGTAPVARVTQVSSSTRIAMCCFMGVYVDYTPQAFPPAVVLLPHPALIYLRKNR